MRTITIPVSASLVDDKYVASLLALAPLEQVEVSGSAPPTLAKAGNTSLRATSINRELAANLGFESLVSVEINASTQYLLLDVITQNPPVPGKPGSIIQSETYGAGFRVCVKVWNLDGKSTLSVAGVSAECTVKAARSSYELVFLGIDLGELEPVVPFIGAAIGTFDAAAVERLGTLISAADEIITSPTSTIRPVLLSVDVDPNDLRLPHARSFSTSYALQSIWDKKRTLDEAIRNIPSVRVNGGSIREDLVRGVYQSILGNVPATTQPSGDQRTIAMKTLFWAE